MSIGHFPKTQREKFSNLNLSLTRRAKRRSCVRKHGSVPSPSLLGGHWHQRNHPRDAPTRLYRCQKQCKAGKGYFPTIVNDTHCKSLRRYKKECIFPNSKHVSIFHVMVWSWKSMYSVWKVFCFTKLWTFVKCALAGHCWAEELATPGAQGKCARETYRRSV